MPNHVDGALVHAMSGYELSRVRTELCQLRIFPTVAPHPVQPNREFSGHGHLGNSFFPAQRQVHIPTPPVRITTHRCLRCFHQQEAQQCVALLADVSQPLPAGYNALRRNHLSGPSRPTIIFGNARPMSCLETTYTLHSPLGFRIHFFPNPFDHPKDPATSRRCSQLHSRPPSSALA